MIVWEFPNVDAALRYWSAVAHLGANTLAEPESILEDFANAGELSRVFQTDRTKAEIIKDWTKHSKVLDFSSPPEGHRER